MAFKNSKVFSQILQKILSGVENSKNFRINFHDFQFSPKFCSFPTAILWAISAKQRRNVVIKC